MKKVTLNLLVMIIISLMLMGCPEPPQLMEDITDLQAVPGEGSVTLSWTDPQDGEFDHAEIWYGIGSANTQFQGIADHNGTTISGLTSGQAYTFRVLRVNHDGSQSSGISMLATPTGSGSDTTPPSEVSGPLAESQELMIILTWGEEHLEPDFDHVNISYTSGDTGITYHVDSEDIEPGRAEIATTMHNLLYTFVIKTVDASGNESEGFGNEGQITAYSSNTFSPAEVSALQAVEGVMSLTVSWTDPADADFDHVEIWYESTTTSSTEFSGTKDATGTIISDLTAGEEYTVRVKTVDTAGNTSTGRTATGTPEDYPITTYALGDTGPAGGYISYIDTLDEYDWEYLEAAPINWFNADSTEYSCSWAAHLATSVGTSEGYDKGQYNTDRITAAYNSSAAGTCASAVVGGYDDWFLPTKDQLFSVYTNLFNIPSPVGDFSPIAYWTSEEYTGVTQTKARLIDFSTGTSGPRYKDGVASVRPMRSFTYDDMVATPTISRTDRSRISSSRTIEISTTTSEAKIYYTTNGSTPTENSTEYSSSFIVNDGTTVKAIAIKGGYDDSSIAEETF